MFNKDSQYISVVKYNTQLKVDYKKVDEGKTAYSKESTFIVHDKMMPKDIALKLNTWQDACVRSYITTIALDSTEKLVSKLESKKYEKDHTVSSLNAKYDVVFPNETLTKTKSYFGYTGVDFVFSPFHVLNLYMELNPSKNSLFFFTINNFAYILITDGKSKIIDSRITELSSFEEIQNTKFFETDVVGQKLFDEIYYLQLQEAIQEAVKDFYALQNDNFIEKINILYTQKQLSDAQIDALHNDIMIDINYRSISVKEALFELSKAHDKKVPMSLIKPRKKRSKALRNIVLGLIFVLVALGFTAVYFEHDIYQALKDKEIIEEPKKQEVIVEKPTPKLPNHIVKNETLAQEIASLLSYVPIDALLKSIEFKKDNCIMSMEMLNEDTFIKAIQPKVLEHYKYSNIQFKDPKAVILDATVYNNEKLNKATSLNAKLPQYIQDEFIPIKRVTEQLKAILPKETIVRFKDSFKSEVTTFNYESLLPVKSPREFFEMVDMLNKEQYSINISYPIALRRVNDKIEVSFILQFHQNH